MAGFLTKVNWQRIYTIVNKTSWLVLQCGLLLKDNYEQVRFAYRLYQRTDDEGNELAARFKETFCRHVEIQFVGVWDTVASVGVFREHTLPFTSSNHGIKTFRHALALDEVSFIIKAPMSSIHTLYLPSTGANSARTSGTDRFRELPLRMPTRAGLRLQMQLRSLKV